MRKALFKDTRKQALFDIAGEKTKRSKIKNYRSFCTKYKVFQIIKK